MTLHVHEGGSDISVMSQLSSALPDGDQQDHDQREDHLHVGYGVHAEGAQHQQLHHLQEGEVVDLPLWHFADVVGGRVRRLQRARGSGQIKENNLLLSPSSGFLEETLAVSEDT